jgi:2-keto-4-pentenoate hydratase/2-oxohepta-3-ene-1,7-dioic acid hydratase in catechol pathway
MKLVRYGRVNEEKPGILDTNGSIRDISHHCDDLTPDLLNDVELARLATLNLSRLPVVSGHVRYGVPLAGTRKFIGIGLNYADHARESNLPIPEEPVVFTKAITSLNGPNDDVIKPLNSLKMDWEVELGVVIGTRAKYVSEGDALNYVAGYTIVNDLSERSFQNERGGLWDKGKGCDTFGPVGPWLVTKDEVGDVQNLDMWLDVNGRRMQTGNTRTMIFGVATIVSYVSQFMTLEAGDIITTGTPPGVGMGMTPPTYLEVGDVITLGIEKLGQQRQTVRADSAAVDSPAR